MLHFTTLMYLTENCKEYTKKYGTVKNKREKEGERLKDALPGSWLATWQALLIQAPTVQKDKIKAI